MRQTMTQTYKPIYDIVMVSDDQVNKDEDGYYVKRTRHVGFYHSWPEALIAVKENRMDIREGDTYNFAYIITRYPGLYDAGIERTFFKWHKESNSFVETEEPATLRDFGF